ncbi:MAG: lipoprotein [Bacteroidales bacterium]|nr:lipoprotein [Bacteroidales bacterium]MBO5848500.1 lipoprotein [Bacteroidales bacterium]
MKKTRFIILILTFMFLLTSCSQAYYKPTNVPKNKKRCSSCYRW